MEYHCSNTWTTLRSSFRALKLLLALSNMMDIFFDFSGLQLNRAKSIFLGFGLSIEETSRCARLLETPIGTLPVRYLGLTLADRRLRVQD